MNFHLILGGDPTPKKGDNAHHAHIVIIITGASGSGKSTVADSLAICLNCTVLHQDDFFSGSFIP
jgi:uridine kinase